jgi:histone H3/H4
MTDFDGNDVDLSIRSVKNIMHNINGRVSDDAALVLAYRAQREIMNMTKAAQVVANGKGRETIKEEDVREVEEILGQFSDLEGMFDA